MEENYRHMSRTKERYLWQMSRRRKHGTNKCRIGDIHLEDTTSLAEAAGDDIVQCILRAWNRTSHEGMEKGNTGLLTAAGAWKQLGLKVAAITLQQSLTGAAKTHLPNPGDLQAADWNGREEERSTHQVPHQEMMHFKLQTRECK